jgi:hypothetical protein
VFGSKTAFSELEMNTFSVSPGYSHTLVYKKFFVNGSFSVGPAVHWLNYVVDARANNTTVANSFIDLRIGLGYNGDRFFAGVNFVGQARSAKFEGIQFFNSSSTFKILFGYRFKEFGILKHKATDLLPIIGIKK